MKKILMFILLSFLFTNVSFSQTVSSDMIVNEVVYPKYVVDSLGHTCVIITIEQARTIDTKLDILNMLDSNNIQVAGLDPIYIKVINEYKHIIAEQEILIEQLEIYSGNKDSVIINLQDQITEYKIKEIYYQKAISLKEDEIDIHMGRITDLERKMLIGGIGGGLIITTVVILVLTN